MAQFVLVINGISTSQLEKVLEIKNKSEGKVDFVPQHSNEHGVQTTQMTSVKKDQNSPEVVSSLRLEWADRGSQFGAQIVKLFGAEK